MNKRTRIAIIGSGMGSLAAAALLAKRGYAPTVLEQNYLPGGCTSSYFRQGYIFEAGATTLVGLDEYMPLRAILEETGIALDLVELPEPMQVHFPGQRPLQRHKDLDTWIAEAEDFFGAAGQRGFWEECYAISQFVWQTSLQHQSFPPSSWRDISGLVKGFRPKQLLYVGYAFRSTQSLLKKHGLLSNALFCRFVNEQLLITAQNSMEEVNALFGATALCYTNYGNYYVYGGLIQLVRPFVEYIEQQGGAFIPRCSVERLRELPGGGYTIETNLGTWESEYLLSGLPINNTLKLWPDNQALQDKFGKKLMGSQELNSAFQLSLALERRERGSCLHHQIHLAKPLPHIGSSSIFLSLSHADDWYRAPLDKTVASVSTHIPNPAAFQSLPKEEIEAAIIDALEEQGLLRREDILYAHSSAASSWARWTKREHGFVGGYPQYMRIKPWQMLDARLDKKRAYICGDSCYPGQGIPGVSLSAILAVQKMQADGLV